ncbi:MAG: hypothetical protein Q8Q29_00585 [Actinomycetota bacterium]|nr:hypothetical protein [Actinomycetota bacterium]
MSRTAADLLTARALAGHYRDMARDIDRESREPDLRAMPLTQRILRQYAAIARRAAIAEEVDLEPPVRGCGVCGGTLACLAVV